MFITLLCVQLQSFAQDSISKRFAVLYDAYRITKGMNPLCSIKEEKEGNIIQLEVLRSKERGGS
jgi:hypothetical protein